LNLKGVFFVSFYQLDEVVRVWVLMNDDITDSFERDWKHHKEWKTIAQEYLREKHKYLNHVKFNIKVAS